MTAFGELMDGAVRADALRLNGGSFATERFGVVRGRIARRRAARSAGVGGASVLGIGVLAVGGSHIAGGGLGFGGPGSSPSVVCTTTTPDAVAGSPMTVPDGATFAIIDNATGAVFFAGLVDGLPVSWNTDGSVVPMERVTNNSASLALPSGATVLLQADDTSAGFSMAPSDDHEVAFMGAHEYATQVATQDSSGSPIAAELDRRLQTVPVDGFAILTVDVVDWDVTQHGVTLATAHREGDTISFTFADGAVKEYDVEGVRRVSVEMPDGTEAIFKLDGAALTYEGSVVAHSSPAAQATSVTCVTSSPEPSGSSEPTVTASASASAQPTSSAEPVPTASWSWDPAAIASPFQCGFEFDKDESSAPGLEVSSVTWKSGAEFNDWIAARYQGDAPEYAAEGERVVEVTVADSRTVSHGAATGAGVGGVQDPTAYAGTSVMGDVEDGASFAQGTTFVAVRDSRVIGAVQERPGAHGLFIYLDNVDGTDHDVLAAFVQPDDAMTACPGVDLGTDWQLYVVAGQTFVYPDGAVDVPIYAWKRIEPEGN